VHPTCAGEPLELDLATLRFTESFDTADLEDANALLDALSSRGA
jgi:hypothetical protein